MPVFLQFTFFSPSLIGSCLKMEFDHIKSNAALIYDEFIQKAGEF